MPGYARQTSTDTSGILATTTVRNVGDSEQLLYTATKKSEVTAIQVANRTGGILPVSVYAKRTVTASVSNKILTSNVATLTTSAAHGLFTGDSVVVSSVDATFNGTYTITTVGSNTTFSYAKVASNVASAAVSPVGSAVRQRGYTAVTDFASQGSTSTYNVPGNSDYNADNAVDFIIASSEDPTE